MPVCYLIVRPRGRASDFTLRKVSPVGLANQTRAAHPLYISSLIYVKSEFFVNPTLLSTVYYCDILIPSACNWPCASKAQAQLLRS
jgi:hypothetical protein